jgi:hypothetical protein
VSVRGVIVGVRVLDDVIDLVGLDVGEGTDEPRDMIK